MGAERTLSPTVAVLTAWTLLAAAQAAAVAAVFVGKIPGRKWILVELYTAGYAAALAVLFVACVALWDRARVRGRLARAGAVAAGAAIVSFPVLDEDLAGPAGRLSELAGLPYAVLHPIVCVAASIVVPLAFVAGGLASRRWVRWIAVPLALGAGWLNGTELPYAYPGLHLAGAVSAGVFVATALAGAELPRVAERLGPLARQVAAGIFALGAAPALLLTPANDILIELERQPAAVLAPYPLFPQDDSDASAEPPAELAPWLERRRDHPPVPPWPKRPLGEAPIVVLVGVDSLRADLFDDAERRKQLPNLFALRDGSLFFTEARSPGTSTGPALAAIFSGVYYSHQLWAPHPKRPFEPFPHQDETVRFPEVLAAAGVMTISADVTGWLTNEFGIARGFSVEERLRDKGEGYPRAKEVMDRLLPLLEEHQGGPLFAFAHMLDAHSPYNSVVRHGPPFERYVAEVGAVDAQLKRLRTALSKPSIKDRACLIVYSDHGEAFGEHGLTFHGQALYDVLLRVPLMIWTPGRRSARIDTPVSLVDIGPTVLDLFGLATPGTSMGQSLAPLLTGDEPALTRPIVAEARLKRAMVFPDGVKIIHDTRMRTVQLYDLRKDPKEEDNLFDGDSDDARRRLGLLKRLFDAHALDRPGYRPPYRKW